MSTFTVFIVFTFFTFFTFLQRGKVANTAKATLDQDGYHLCRLGSATLNDRGAV